MFVIFDRLFLISSRIFTKNYKIEDGVNLIGLDPDFTL